MTRNIVNKAFLKYKSDLEEEKKRQKEKELVGMDVDVSTADDSALLSDLSGDVPVKSKSAESVVSSLQVRPKGGRPVGSTIKAKEDKNKRVFQAKNLITKRFSAMKRKCGPKGKVKDGTLVRIINEVKEELNIKEVTILPNAIRQRFYRKKEVCHHVAGHISPLEKIESTVISIVIHMASIRQSLCPSEGLMLVNSLIKDTNLQKELVDWKKKYSNNCSPTVGHGYWSRFMKRHKDKIVSKRGQRYELNRQKWTTYANFVHMYSHCINEMVEAGVAVELDSPVWMDRAGNEVEDEADAYGCKVTHKVIRPESCNTRLSARTRRSHSRNLVEYRGTRSKL